MATTADFRTGLCIEFNGDVYSIVEFLHVKPGKGFAFVRSKLKSLSTGKVIENTFDAGEKVNTARIEKRAHQFTFKDDYGYHFMDSETFEEMIVPEELVPDADLMKDGQDVFILYYVEKERVMGVELPQFIDLKVTYTEPGIRGDTATRSLKPATLETGARIQVPLFIEQDELIRINTADRSYYERVR
jgi:elongation factor P